VVLDSHPTSCSSKQASIPYGNLGTGLLRSSRQRGQATELKKAPGMPVNDSCKRSLVVMEEAHEPYIADESPEFLRKVACQVGAMDARIKVELERLNRELNLSSLVADRAGPPKGPPPLNPNPGHEGSALSEHAETRRSAKDSLMLDSWGEQPVNPLATQVGIPGRIYSPFGLATNVVAVDNQAACQPGRELSPAADFPTDPMGFTTRGEFRLQLLGFSSILLAMCTLVLLAETGIGCPLTAISVLAH